MKKREAPCACLFMLLPAERKRLCVMSNRGRMRVRTKVTAGTMHLTFIQMKINLD